jgi:hypothetical protein
MLIPAAAANRLAPICNNGTSITTREDFPGRLHSMTRCFLSPLVAVLLAGCTPSGPTVVPLEGTVTHNGAPVPDLRISFEPEKGRPSWATTDKNGHFVAHYDEDHWGVVVGTHALLVFEDTNRLDPLLLEGKPRPKRTPEMQAVLEKYGSREKSPLKLEFKKADRHFELKLD